MIQVDTFNVKATSPLDTFFLHSNRGPVSDGYAEAAKLLNEGTSPPPNYFFDTRTQTMHNVGRGLKESVFVIGDQEPIDHLPKPVREMIQAVHHTQHVPVIVDEPWINVKVNTLDALSREKQHIEFKDVWFLKTVGEDRYAFFAVATKLPPLLKKYLHGKTLCVTGILESKSDFSAGTCMCNVESTMFHTESKKATKFIKDAGLFGYSLRALRTNVEKHGSES